MEPQERVDLALFNAAVDAWADRFTPDKMKRFAYTIGKSADKVFHTHYVSYQGLMQNYQRMYGRPISYTTLWRRLHQFAELGIIDITNRKRSSESEWPGTNMTNLYTVHFNRVYVAGKVLEHDFYEPVRTDFGTPVGTLDETKVET